MRPLHRLLPALAAVTVAVGALLIAVVPVLAKEGFEARLDAPIARDTPGGTTLLVGLTVTFPDGGTSHPVEGSPISIRVTAPDGTSTWELAAERGAPGHYEARVVVPAGGVAKVEVGIHGSPSDLPITVLGTPIVAGGITSTTAQVAPPLAPAITPIARAPQSPAAVAPAAGPATSSAPAPTPVAAIALGAALAFLALVAAVAIVRRNRSSGRLGGAPRTHGA